MRVTVRAKPGSRTERVTLLAPPGDDDPAVVVVRVTARPVDGKANSAVLRALAAALDVRPARMTLLRGQTSRVKHVEIDDDPAALTAALAALAPEDDIGG